MSASRDCGRSCAMVRLSLAPRRHQLAPLIDAYQLIKNLASALASACRSILIYETGRRIAAITRHRPAQQSPPAPATASAL
jgi:hypothetical protein